MPEGSGGERPTEAPLAEGSGSANGAPVGGRPPAPPPPGSGPLGAATPEAALPADDESLRVLLLLRPNRGDELAAAIAAMAEAALAEREYLDDATFAERYGARPADIAAVESWAADRGLAVTEINAAGRLVELTGTSEQITAAFDFEFEAVKVAEAHFRRPDEEVVPPPDLAEIVEGVFGLDEVPRFETTDRSALLVADPDAVTRDGDATSGTGGRPTPTLPADIARLYRFPEEADGSGETVAVVLLGGGFFPDDMQEYFGGAGPEIAVAEVGGARNAPAPREAVDRFLDELSSGKPPSADAMTLRRIWWTIESTVDIQLVGSFAPGARIVAYFAPNSERGKIDALVGALTDEDHRPSVISCSWGMREIDAEEGYLAVLDRVFQLAALKGVSLCYSSGDKGANLSDDGTPQVHFPASSPHVLSCGGTRLQPPEVGGQSAWHEPRGPQVLATGGGFSRYFPRPSWQRAAVPSMVATADVAERLAAARRRGLEGGRAVPDVAGKADYAHGYRCRLAGRAILGGGTSVAAPMWAALVARANQALGRRAGLLPPLIYRLPADAGALHDIHHGTNGHYQAGRGWDPTTGLGTPYGDRLVAALRRG